MTKREMFTAILAVDAVAENPDMVEFLNHQLELLDSRNVTKKPTKTQLENENIKDIICEVLGESEVPMRVKDMREDPRLAEYSQSKLSALLRLLLPDSGDGRVVKITEKKISYFSLA